MTSTMRQFVFLIAAIAGLVATWYHNIQFVLETGGFSLAQFVSATQVNAAAASISNDILVVAVTFLFWSYFEARRLGIKRWWLFVGLTFGIAMAFAFPLFLLLRERKLRVSDNRVA